MQMRILKFVFRNSCQHEEKIQTKQADEDKGKEDEEDTTTNKIREKN